MPQQIGSGGSKELIANGDSGTTERVFVTCDKTTLLLGGTLTIKHTFDKRGKYPVVNNLCIRCKPKNTSENDAWSFPATLWGLVDTLKIKINGKEVLKIEDANVRDIYHLRLQKTETQEEGIIQSVLDHGAVTWHNDTAVAKETTLAYKTARMDSVTDLFHDLRVDNGIRDFEVELKIVNDTATALYKYLTYDNSTGEEALSTYFSLINIDAFLDMHYYDRPQTTVGTYVIPTKKFDRREFADYAVASADLEYTLDLDSFHKINNIHKVHMWANVTETDSNDAHKLYMGYTAIDQIRIKKAGKEVTDYYDQRDILKHISISHKKDTGKDWWFFSQALTVQDDEATPLFFIDFTNDNRFKGEGTHIHGQGITNKDQKWEIILENNALTATVNKLVVLVESQHLVSITSDGTVTSK